MKNLKIIALISLISCSLLGGLYWLLFSNNDRIVYNGVYKNQPVVVKLITKEGFIRNTYSHSVQWGGLKPIHIDWNSTDTRGVPYDNAMFDASNPLFIDKSHNYQNELTYDNFDVVTMLYVGKDSMPLEEYRLYQDFLKNNWLEVQQKLLNQQNGFYTRIVGMVYGDRKDFIKVFTGVYENKIFDLTIASDGEIVLSRTGNVMLLQNSGLSNKVQMPGKIVLKKENQGNNFPNYDDFKDSKGKTFKDYFAIEMDKR
ncbi:hypothetical protein [Acinetobacter sp.]|uniref:hypothetical protein n=1 Tax=Acinetobacter sp. TaxID=472 RepID=UPI0037522D11